MTANRGKKILLVVPPFWSGTTPYLGASQLKANLVRAGHPTEVLYLNFLFSKRIGPQAADYLSIHTNNELLGEYIFSAALFGREPGDVEDYLKQVLAGSNALRWIERKYSDSPATVLTRWREEAVDFCDGEGLERILERDAWLVGFSSTFQQNCAALALMDRLRRARPEVITVLGGANCEGERGEELMTRFPFIDHLGQGEADHSLVALADALAEGGAGHGIPGMRSRGVPDSAHPGRPLTGDELDALPYPDFDDFFGQRVACGFEHHLDPWLAMETARGCWWGAKHHCKFCGLNSETIGFRSKSPQRVLDEIDGLLDRHGPIEIRMADNILDMKYFKTLLPRLAETRPAALFWETKANLTRDQVGLLAEARVKRIQPGIESLSDEGLRLMDKGTTRMQNVQLLRWCAEYGIGVDWNYLIGFPGEDDAELPEIAGEIEALHHLEPPGNYGVMRIYRFSPYFTNADAYGLGPLAPSEPYRHIYPFPPDSLARIAYYFRSEPLEQKADTRGNAIVRKMVLRWRKVHGHSFLVAIHRRKNIVVVDTRPGARRRIHRLTGLRRAVYEYCQRPRGLERITRDLGADVAPRRIEAAVESLVRDRLMLASGGRYFSLGVEPALTGGLENAPAGSAVEDHLGDPFALRAGPGFWRAPNRAISSWSRRFRHARRSWRGRWTRRGVLLLVRLLQEPEPTSSSPRVQVEAL